MMKRPPHQSIALVLGSALLVVACGKSGGAQANPAASAGPLASGLNVVRQENPARSIVNDASGQWLATFTDGARTVTVRGAERSLREQGSDAEVRTDVHVRLLPAAFDGRIDEAWLAQAQADGSPDVFDVGLEFVAGGPQDAQYGPLQADGSRQEGSDFNDFLGIDYTYPDGSVDRPEAGQRGSLDCSGFVRMVLGYRLGLPLANGPTLDDSALPRRAVQMLDGAPGAMVIANPGSQVTQMDALQPGDLVFFDADPGDGPSVDHVGLYLGRDTAGHARFLSSRKGANGPTLGDDRGASLLDGPGLYARAFRAARRV